MATDLISDEYKALLVEKHDGKPWGGAGKSWIPMILPMLNSLPPEATRILDFGCGRGTFKEAMADMAPMYEVLEYDPGVRGKDQLPVYPVDYVVCTDVLEHVESYYLVDTLRMINWLAIHGVFFNIDTAPSKSFLPDGRNTHINIRPSGWWKSVLDQHVGDMNWNVHEETKSRIVISGWRKTHVE